jgi:hypothetical protein
MNISWKLKVGFYGAGSFEFCEKRFEQVHINNTTEKYYRGNNINYWQPSLKKFHKRLFK